MICVEDNISGISGILWWFMDDNISGILCLYTLFMLYYVCFYCWCYCWVSVAVSVVGHSLVD